MKSLFLLITCLYYFNCNAQYTFGDEMMDFVLNDAHDYAFKELSPDFLGRSFNGFQVTLDKSREQANNSYNLLESCREQLQQNHDLAILLKNALAKDNINLTDSDISRIASAISFSKDFCFRLLESQEKVKAVQRNLESLNNPLTFYGFKNLDLDLGSYLYIINSIGGTKPDFQMSISASVTYSDGSFANNENAANGGFFFLDAYNAYMDNKVYEQQTKKYYKALDLLPSKLPKDTTSYRIYKNSFEEVRKLFSDEHKNLKTHIDSLDCSIENAYLSMQNFRSYFESGLLDDRVKAAYLNINMDNFSPQAMLQISSRAREIANTRKNITRLKNKAIYSGNKITAFVSLEDISEISKEAIKIIKTTSIEPLFIPISKYLDENLQFFQSHLSSADNLLKTNKLPTYNSFANGKDTVSQIPFVKLMIDDISYSEPISLKVLKMESNSTNSLSIAHYWPYSTGNASLHSNYSSSGLGVWERGTDGAFIRDSRSSSYGMIGRTRTNLKERTIQASENVKKARDLVQSSSIQRTNEVTSRSSDISHVNRSIFSATKVLPKFRIEFDLSSHKWDALSRVEEKLILPQNTQEKIASETERTNQFLNSQHTSWRTEEKKEFETKSKLYLTFAKALEFAEYSGLAEAMLNAATYLRAVKTGYPIDNQTLPTFDVPDIPFSPFKLEDTKKIYERHLNYIVMNDNLGDRSLWFKAAAIVTGETTLKILDFVAPDVWVKEDGPLFIPAFHFLKEGNEFLYEDNMKNGQAILQGTLTGTFQTPEGKIVAFDGLTGKQLDYALVEYEQSKVQDYIHIYKNANPKNDMLKIFLFINSYMQTTVPPTIVRQAMFVGFNFADYNDRVKLGHRIIDILYKQKNEPKGN